MWSDAVGATVTTDRPDHLTAEGDYPYDALERAWLRRPSPITVLERWLQVWAEGLSSSERSAHLGRYTRGNLPSGTSYTQERERARMALDWVARRHMPAWMDLIPELAEHAAALRALPPIDSDDAWSQVLPTCEAVSRDVWQPSCPDEDQIHLYDDASDAIARSAGQAAWCAGWHFHLSPHLVATLGLLYTARRRVWTVVAWLVATGAIELSDLEAVVADLQESAHERLARMIEVTA